MAAKPRLLELFAGTGSVGKVFADDFEVVSLDVVGSPTIKEDIMTWDYTNLPSDYFKVVWASPPCTMYSRARTTAKTPRDLEGSDAMVQKTLDIMHHFLPCVWLMENPQTGLLKSRPVVDGLPYRDVTYCRYGARFKKPTRIWNNLGDFWHPRPLCSKHDPCPNVVEGRHPVTAQRLSGGAGDQAFSREELYAIPPELVEELRAAVLRKLADDTPS